MKRVFRHAIKIMLILCMTICWALAIGYTNELATVRNTFNIYFDKEQYTPIDIYNMQEEESKEENSVAFVGWYEKDNEYLLNNEFNRTIESNIIFICGNSSFIVNGPILFADDKNGCLIDEDTAQKLFGSSNVLGNIIFYNDKELVVRGIHKGVSNTVIMQADRNSQDNVQGISIDINNEGKSNIHTITERYGIKDYGVNNAIYYNLGKICTSILPIIILLIVICSFIKEAIKIKDRPVIFIGVILALIVGIYIFFIITKYKISIPVDILPSKWSDFEYWKKFFDECIDKIRYIMYMKKYSLDIFLIENLLKVVLYTIIIIGLFFINIKYINVESIKELYISVILIFIIVFLAIVYLKDINISIVSSRILWFMIPYYLVYKHIYINREKYLNKIIS